MKLVGAFLTEKDLSSDFCDSKSSSVRSCGGLENALAELVRRPGRHSFLLVVEDGGLVELRAVPEAQFMAETELRESDYLSMRRAAKVMGKSYSWISRHRRELENGGLMPRRIGRNLRYRRADVMAFIERQAVSLKRGRGRPRIVVRTVQSLA